MALVQASLKSELVTIFSSRLASPDIIAQRLAQAYTTYALAGMFGASTPVILPTHTAALQNSLKGAISNPKAGSAALFAQAWVSGLTSFWLTPPVLVAGAQVGTVTAIPGAAALVAPLTALFLNLKASYDSVGDGLSLALHGASLTVLSTVAPPPGTVLTLL